MSSSLKRGYIDDQPIAQPTPALEEGKVTIHVISTANYDDDEKKKKKKKKKKNVDEDATADEQYEYDEDDDDDYVKVQKQILKRYPLLLEHMKRGDAVCDLDDCGYRSSGIYFVDSVDPIKKTLSIVDRCFEISEYGTQPKQFTTLDEFPIDYFHDENAQFNDMYHPEHGGGFNWHYDEGWNIFSTELTSKIVVCDKNENYISGTLEYKGVVYHFEYAPVLTSDDGDYVVTTGYNEEERTFYGE